MKSKNKLFITLSLTVILLISSFLGLIGYKKETVVKDKIQIELTVTKFFFFAHVNTKVTNFSNKTLTYLVKSSCDRALKISGNDSFMYTYKPTKPKNGCFDYLNNAKLKPNGSFNNSENFFKSSFSSKPIVIESSFKESDIDLTNESKNKDMFFIKTSVSFLQ